ncbi:DUF1707 SHOCT-like domain-containing protein [Rhodococcoides corynebacterioides]|uniref:DUF1707 domain-containing protein n=1 Tax=Rhodococcoides corynebacterioides TaxID=53972 RepID=A0ABS7P7S0_9NOCA|nr:DUF1707 domain-containing protein [Rhodococcus corynebacterioides]MBY6368360.1 DUF1707 domain-containing protein [Rhodococcus corynebacterioides]MBY6407553.1 DUF1707 domain-containing protein [Rhodococcus corynebacterioides]
MTQPRSSLRARDVDRAVTATALDRAYADGQLTFDEHRTRSASARSARTVGDLHALVSDLQSDVPLPEPEVPRRARRPWRRWPLVAAVAVVVAAGGWALARDPDPAPAVPTADAPAPAPDLPPDVSPIVAQPFAFDTAAGLADFRARWIERFGSAEIYSMYLDLGDRRASVTRPVADGRQQQVNVMGGFDPSDSTSEPSDSERTLDWTTLNVDALAGHLAGAPLSLGRPNGVVDTVNLRNFGTPEIRLDVVDPRGEGVGTVVVDPAGAVLSVEPD